MLEEGSWMAKAFFFSKMYFKSNEEKQKVCPLPSVHRVMINEKTHRWATFCAKESVVS